MDGSTPGLQIKRLRENRGWSQRKLASKVGMSRRELIACETDSLYPEPRKEKRTIRSLFIPFLGYSVRCYTDWPVTDKNFNLEKEQDRIMRLLQA